MRSSSPTHARSAAWVAALAATLGSCGADRRAALLEVFGDDQALEIVAAPTRVTACRLGPLPGALAGFDPAPTDYPALAEPVVVATDAAQELAAILGSPGTYLVGVTKSCRPRYGVRVELERAGSRVDVLFCFECDLLAAYHDGHHGGSGSFDPARADLVAVMRRIFPDDEVVGGM